MRLVITTDVMVALLILLFLNYRLGNAYVLLLE